MSLRRLPFRNGLDVYFLSRTRNKWTDGLHCTGTGQGNRGSHRRRENDRTQSFHQHSSHSTTPNANISMTTSGTRERGAG